VLTRPSSQRIDLPDAVQHVDVLELDEAATP